MNYRWLLASAIGIVLACSADAQPLPTLSVNDVSAMEGSSGAVAYTFTVTLSAPSASTVTVAYATQDGTASAGSDYAATSGSLLFTPGQTSLALMVSVSGDTAVESNEAFGVALSGASNATIARPTGQGTIINDDPVPASAIASGLYHACALTPQGVVKCWGLNGSQQLGNGPFSRSSPAAVEGLIGQYAAVAGGGAHTCAVTTAGGVKCWGSNASLQLGRTSQGGAQFPSDVIGLTSGVSAIAAGLEHTCALTTAGGVKCWGSDRWGQLGRGTAGLADATPADVVGLTTGVVSIGVGFSHSCALTSGGAVKCWGSNEYGQLGFGPSGFGSASATPLDVPLGGGASGLGVARSHSCAVQAGAVKCWGSNSSGQLGDGTRSDRVTPVSVVGLPAGVTGVFLGDWHTCALANGSVSCWGENLSGQLGDGTTTSRNTPAPTLGLAADTSALALGQISTCALAANGSVRCWGGNNWGQLGDGTTTFRKTPSTVMGLDWALRRPQPAWHEFFAVNALETPYVGDFNGDGRTDIITFTRQNPNAIGDVYVSLSTGTRFGISDVSTKWHDFFAITTDETVVIGDYDGDGKDDIATWLGTSTRQVYVALSTGTGMTTEASWLASIGSASTDYLAAGDANGDGRDDLILFARTEGKVYAAISNGVQFGAPSVWHPFFAVSTYERPRVADVNGDGKADIVTFATDSPTAFGDVYVATSNGAAFRARSGSPTSDKWHDFFAIRPTEEVRLADFNGDGLSDFYTFLPPPFAQCYTLRSQGTNMATNVLWPEPVAPALGAGDNVFVGDVNGDGKADLIIFAQGEGKVYVSLAS